MIRRIVGIARDRCESLLSALESHGYSVTVLARRRRPCDESLPTRRYICERNGNAAALTIVDSHSDTTSSLVVITSSFWLLLRHGKITRDRAILFELAAVVRGVALSIDGDSIEREGS
jgi:hypothetical protein